MIKFWLRLWLLQLNQKRALEIAVRTWSVVGMPSAVRSTHDVCIMIVTCWMRTNEISCCCWELSMAIQSLGDQRLQRVDVERDAINYDLNFTTPYLASDRERIAQWTWCALRLLCENGGVLGTSYSFVHICVELVLIADKGNHHPWLSDRGESFLKTNYRLM